MSHPTDLLCSAIAKSVAELLTPLLGARITPRLLDLNQAGIYIGRPPQMVRKLVSAGKIPNSSGDRRILIDRSDLDHFIDRCKIDPSAG